MKEISKTSGVHDVVKSVKDVTPREEWTTEEFIKKIQQGKFKPQVENYRKLKKAGHPSAQMSKEKLPCIVVGGKCSPTVKDANLIQYAGEICIDIDKLQKQGVSDISTLQKGISMLPYVRGISKSCGGDGLFIIVPHSGSYLEHKIAAEQICDMMEFRYGIEIDRTASKVLSGRRIVSSDPEAYYNADALEFKLLKQSVFDHILAQKLFTDGVISFVTGNRNNYVYQFGCNCAKNGISINDCITFSKQWFIAEDMDQNEIKRTIVSAFDTVKSGTTSTTVDSDFKYDSDEVDAKEDSPGAKAPLYMRLDQAIEMYADEEGTPMLWAGIPDGPGLTLIVAPSKAGKTIFAENLGYALASNLGKFLGLPIPSGKRVLFISLEEYASRRLQRNKKQLDQLKAESINVEQVYANYFVVSKKFPRHCSVEDGMMAIKKIVEDLKPDVIMIDSLSRLYSGAIENSEKAKKVIQPLKDYADEIGCPILLIHHTRKLGDQTISMDAIAGSRVLSQECDTMIGIGKVKSGKRYWTPLAYRYGDDTVDKVGVFEINSNCIVEYGGEMFEDQLFAETDGRRQKRLEKVEMVREHLKIHPVQKTTQLFATFVNTGIMGKDSLYGALDKLKELGEIKSTHGKYKYIKPKGAHISDAEIQQKEDLDEEE